MHVGSQTPSSQGITTLLTLSSSTSSPRLRPPSPEEASEPAIRTSSPPPPVQRSPAILAPELPSDVDTSQRPISIDLDHHRDIDEEEHFQDAVAGVSSLGNIGASLPPSSPDRQSINADWNEAEYQKLVSDRNSRHSADTRYDEEGQTADSDLSDGEEPNGTEQLTYGHSRNSSVGSSLWAGRGAVPVVGGSRDSNGSMLTSASAKKRTPLHPLPPVPNLPMSSLALQQLRTDSSNEEPSKNHLTVDSKDSPTSGLLHSAYNSPTPSYDAQEAFTDTGPIKIDNEEFDLVNPLRPKTSSLSARRESGPSRTAIIHPISSPRAAAIIRPSSPSSPSSPAPYTSPLPRRRRRSPVLSFDGGVAEEEALLNSDILAQPGVGSSDPSETGAIESQANRRVSHLGPKLRRNAPAPWEVSEDGYTKADTLAPAPLTSYTSTSSAMPAPTPASSSPSPWNRFARGATGHRDPGESNGRKISQGLSVNLRRPSEETKRRSEDKIRPPTLASHTHLLSPRGKLKFGGKARTSESDAGISLPARAHSPEESNLPRDGSMLSLASLASHRSHVDSDPITSHIFPRIPESASSSRADPFVSAPAAHRTLTGNHAFASRQRKKSSTGGGVLRGLGLGSSSSGSSKQDPSSGCDGDENSVGYSRINSSKLVKTLKKKGERDELSLAKGISSDDYASVSRKGKLENEQPPASSTSAMPRPASAGSSRQAGSLESASATSWRAADANRGLVNPFAKFGTSSDSASIRLPPLPSPPVVPSAPTRTTSRRSTGSASEAVSKPSCDIERPVAVPPLKLHGLDPPPATKDNNLSQQPEIKSATSEGDQVQPSMDRPELFHNVASGYTTSNTPAPSTSQPMRSLSPPPHIPVSPQDLLHNHSSHSAPLPGPGALSPSPKFQRRLSLLTNSVTTSSIASAGSGTASNPATVSSALRAGAVSPPPRGIGVAYRKPGGLPSPSLGSWNGLRKSPTINDFPNTSDTSIMNDRSISSSSVVSKAADFSTDASQSQSQPSASTTVETELANPEAKRLVQKDSLMVSRNVAEVFQRPGRRSSGLAQDDADVSSQFGPASVSQTHVESPPQGSPLPTPGSHEGVAYKLISLEQAQARRNGKVSALSEQRSDVPAELVEPPEFTDVPSHQHVGASENGPAFGRTLKSKKSGLLRIFGRNKGADHESPSGHDSIPSIPMLPEQSKNFKGTGTNLPLPQHAESGMSSTTPLRVDDATIVLGESAVPALGALRPMSSIFASMSPVFGDGRMAGMETLGGEDEDSGLDGVSEASTALDGVSKLHSTAVEGPKLGASGRPLRPDGFGGMTSSYTARPGELALARAHGPPPIIAIPYTPNVAESISTSRSEYPPSPSHIAPNGERVEGMSSAALSTHGSPLPSDAEISKGIHQDGALLSDARAATKLLRLPREDDRRQGIGNDDASLPSPSSSRNSQAQQTLSAQSSANRVQTRFRERVLVIEARMIELVAELSHLRSMAATPRASAPSSPESSIFTEGEQPFSQNGELRATNPIPMCASCGCTCAEMKRQQALKEVEALKRPATNLRSPSSASAVSGSGSVMNRGRGVKKGAEDFAWRFGGGQ